MSVLNMVKLTKPEVNVKMLPSSHLQVFKVTSTSDAHNLPSILWPLLPKSIHEFMLSTRMVRLDLGLNMYRCILEVYILRKERGKEALLFVYVAS